MKTLKVCAAAAALLVLSAAAHAQQGSDQGASGAAGHGHTAPDAAPPAGSMHDGMQMPPTMHGAPGATAAAGWKGDQGPASKAYAEANARMHAEMDIEFSGDADRDFARGMIAHHNGAIAMAKILVEYGKDPELRKLAGEVIEAQSAEIEFLQDWLEKTGSD